MAIAAVGILALAAATIALISWFEFTSLENKLRGLSENELMSLNALVETAMQQRVDDPQNVAIKVFNGWFESRNKEYPGKLWSVWSPKVTAYMAQAYPDRAAKAPVDEIDKEALRTGRPVARFVDGAYRYSLPIILGQTLAAPKENCEGCHGAGDGPAGRRSDRRVFEQPFDRQGHGRPARASVADGGRRGPRVPARRSWRSGWFSDGWSRGR